MAKYTGPVCRFCRKEGEKLFLKGDRCYSDKCAVERRAYGPGQHGKKRKKNSDYSIHLKEKQKVRRIYGVLEKSFRRVFGEAERKKGNTGENLMSLLETRFDNIVYQIGFANSRSEARQIVKHKHLLKNGKRADIPSMILRKGDIIEVKEKSKSVKKLSENIDAGKRREVPKWLEVDREKMRAVVKEAPTREDVKFNVNEKLIIELYSR